jgi:hypothetical protein
MDLQTAGSSSHKLVDSLSSKLIELPSGNVALNLHVPFGSLER